MTSTEFINAEVDHAPLSLGAQYSYSLDADEAAIQRMRQFTLATGLSFLCVHAESGTVLAQTDEDFIAVLPRPVALQLSAVRGPRVWELASGFVFYALPLPDLDGMPSVALGYVLNHGGRVTDGLRVVGDERGWSPDQLAEWITLQKHGCPELIERWQRRNTGEAHARGGEADDPGPHDFERHSALQGAGFQVDEAACLRAG